MPASNYHSYQNIDKTAVFQEARTFSDTQINIKKCSSILTKILYIINQGEVIGKREATDCFFATTRLFQCFDPILRRLVYLVIKEMSCIAQDVIIVTSSLTKDMTGKDSFYRAAAIQTLCKVIDASMIQSIERYIKQALVDKDPVLASAALTSSMHLFNESPEIVKRWANEIQEAANSENPMVQYHSLGLLYSIKKSDKLAVSKLFMKFSKNSLSSAYGRILLIRMASQLITEENIKVGAKSRPFVFLEFCLKHQNEMVVFEALNALISLNSRFPGCITSELFSVIISICQVYSSSSNTIIRYAAVSALNKISTIEPSVVSTCNMELETLISDNDRSVATLAITTLLKTGNEASIERLMKQISSFMSEIGDEFKIIVVQAVRSLCLKFPRKHAVMLNFLSTMLREEGGYDFKKTIVNAIISIIDNNIEAKEIGLSHLCEFIEDCEHPNLAVKILYLLGVQGPDTPQPSKYIRFIYNRVILEVPQVRAAAVSSLAKFGAQVASLRHSIMVLLKRCFCDTDDEVRDRATYYYALLSRDDEIKSDPSNDTPNDCSFVSSHIFSDFKYSLSAFEKALQNYTLSPSSWDTPFDLNDIPKESVTAALSSDDILALDKQSANAENVPMDEDDANKTGHAFKTQQEIYSDKFTNNPVFSAFGPLFKSSQPIKLTEEETEYKVECIKHTFSHFLIFQFNCINTLDDAVLEDVSISMEASEQGFDVIKSTKASILKHGDDEPESIYNCIRLPDDSSLTSCSFNNIMQFTIKDINPDNGEVDEQGYPDSYELETLDINMFDHIKGVLVTNFEASWSNLGSENELEESFVLSSVEAIGKIVDFFGMYPCDGSDDVADNKSLHLLLLAGIFRGGHDCMVKVKMAITAETEGVAVRITARSTEYDISQIIVSSVGQ